MSSLDDSAPKKEGGIPIAATEPRTVSPQAASFLPHSPIPDQYPPPSVNHVVDPTTNQSTTNYELLPFRKRFLFGGRVLNPFWGSPWSFIVMNVLVLAIIGIWASTTAVWWLRNESAAVTVIGSYLCLISLACMYAASIQDPGILPRNLDLEPPRATSSDQSQGQALPRDIKVRSEVIRVKYCTVCRTYRPPRSSHCKECGVCVDRVDHHCVWFNNCIGSRNYTPFFIFLVTMTLSLGFIASTAALHLGLLAHRHHLGFRHAIQHGVGSGVVFCLAWAPLLMISITMIYQVQLALSNFTLIEDIRLKKSMDIQLEAAHLRAFSNGSRYRNILAVVSRPQGLSWLDGLGFTKDNRIPLDNPSSNRPTPPRSEYYFKPPAAASSDSTTPMGQIGVDYPKGILRVERDYKEGSETIRFHTIFPLEIEDRITPQKFSETIDSINNILASAESAPYSTLDNLLRVFTLQISSVLYRTHYEREMQRLQQHINDQNHKFLNTVGLNILWPRNVAFLFLEMEYY